MRDALLVWGCGLAMVIAGELGELWRRWRRSRDRVKNADQLVISLDKVGRSA